MVAIALCTATPTSTQTAVHSDTTASLKSWASSRPGLVA
jgi:hypothetical protein